MSNYVTLYFLSKVTAVLILFFENWLFPFFTCCYGLNTTTVMLWNYLARKPFFNDAKYFHIIPNLVRNLVRSHGRL